LYQSLFFDQQGFLDLSSSSPGQFTLYYNNYKDLKAGDKPKINKSQSSREIPGGDFLDMYYLQLNGDKMKGGLFTESMRSLLLAKCDEKLDWKQFTELLRDEVENQFDQEVPDGKLKTGAGTIFQDAQTIVMREFPQPLGAAEMSTDPAPSSGPATTQFGVSVVANSAGGVTIESVRDGSMAARHGASVGEVIEKINNRPVNTPDELEAALAKAAATFRVTIGGESFVVRQ
jgi:membrane-associated protease RseP (regulator of RpoE activity)